MPETKEILIRNNSVIPILNSGTKIAEIRSEGAATKSLFAPGAGQVELTQAQYDALTPEEKASDTIYFIKDIQDVSVWIGTELEYEALPPSMKANPTYLFVIKEEDNSL